VDPYSPASPDYAERHRETVTVMPDGLVRVDMGEPVHGKPKKADLAKVPKAPAVAPEPAAEAPSATPATPLPVNPKVSRREHRAITRNP
jgi:hypothetical protein